MRFFPGYKHQGVPAWLKKTSWYCNIIILLGVEEHPNCVLQLIKFWWRKTLYREHLTDAPSFSGRWIGIYLTWKRSIKTRKTYVEHLKACHANDLWMHCSTFQESFDQGFVYAVLCFSHFATSLMTFWSKIQAATIWQKCSK